MAVLDPSDRLPDHVETPRLVLRRWHHDEVDALGTAVVANVDHLRPWMAWAKFEPITKVERVALIESWTRDWEDGGDCVFGVFLDGEAIGNCGLHRRLGPGTLEIGYWIDVDHVRHGFATEVTAGLTTTAFAIDGIETVYVDTDEANEASAGVPAKLGFSRTRVDEVTPLAPAQSGRSIIWSIDEPTWSARAR